MTISDSHQCFYCHHTPFLTWDELYSHVIDECSKRDANDKVDIEFITPELMLKSE